MWKLLSSFVFLLLGTTSQSQQIKIDANETVDYLLTYTGNNYEGKERNTKFETAYYNSSSIIGHDHHLDDCFVSCAISDDCLGVYQDYNSTLLYEGERLLTNNTDYLLKHNISIKDVSIGKDSDYICYLLSDLGLGYSLTDTASNSYRKLKHYNFSDHYSNNTIELYLWGSEPRNMYGNTTVYIDNNHNGLLDIGEQNKSSRSGEKVIFYNVPSGIHLIRTIAPELCIPIFPGLRGLEEEYALRGDGYIDTINTYYHHGHSKYAGPHGGYIGSNQTYLNNNFSYILGNDNSTYLSFYPEYNITVGFIDETISQELEIDIYGNSSTWAYVSISRDNVEFYPIGILNSTHHHFNLTELGYSFPVSFVKLHFMGEENEALNIINVHSKEEYIFGPAYGYLTGVPRVYGQFILFYNECNNVQPCEIYCYQMSNEFNREESCLTGCNIFYNHNNCFCSEFNKTIDEDFYGDVFNYEWCNKGCHYEMGWYVGPEFYPIVNATGRPENVIGNIETCTLGCLDNMYVKCINNENCSSFSLSDNFDSYIYDNPVCERSIDDVFMIRKDLYYNLSYYTTSTDTTSTYTTSTYTDTTSTYTTSTYTDTTSTYTTSTYTSSTNTDTTSTYTTSTNTTSTYTDTTSTITETSFTNNSKLVDNGSGSGSSSDSSDNSTSSDNSDSSDNSTSSDSSDNSASSDSSDSSDNSASSDSSDNSASSDNSTNSNNKDNNTSNSNQQSIKDNDSKKDNTLLAVLLAVFVFVVFGFIVLGIMIRRKDINYVPRPNERVNNAGVAFDNPVYNIENDIRNNSLYDETPPNHIVEDENYLDLQ